MGSESRSSGVLGFSRGLGLLGYYGLRVSGLGGSIFSEFHV